MGTKAFLREAGVIAATTIGAGMFGLPYIFLKSGWAVGTFYLVVLSLVVAGAHTLYWRTLAAANEKRLLLGMARDFLGGFWYKLGLCAVILGLIFALVIYLILGSQFIRLFWPSIDGNLGLFLFWLVSIIPLFFEKRVIWLELTGVFFMGGIIFLIFLTAPQLAPQIAVPAVDLNNLFLPFGVVLFSLAGWTAVEPLFKERAAEGRISRVPKKSFLAGTLLAAALYIVFIYGIFGSAPNIASDTLSGLTGWPLWKLVFLGALGIFSLWTSYIPIGLEIKNSLERDLGWRPFYGLALVVFLPPLLVILGLSNFLKVLGLAGGVFLSLQYVLIVLVGRKVLGFSGMEKVFYNLVIAAFILAAVYEVYYVVIN